MISQPPAADTTEERERERERDAPNKKTHSYSAAARFPILYFWNPHSHILFLPIFENMGEHSFENLFLEISFCGGIGDLQQKM